MKFLSYALSILVVLGGIVNLMAMDDTIVYGTPRPFTPVSEEEFSKLAKGFVAIDRINEIASHYQFSSNDEEEHNKIMIEIFKLKNHYDEVIEQFWAADREKISNLCAYFQAWLENVSLYNHVPLFNVKQYNQTTKTTVKSFFEIIRNKFWPSFKS